MIEFKETLERTTPPKSNVDEALKENPLLAVRELNNRSFYDFLKFAWPAISNESFQDNWHIKVICDALQEKAEEVAAQKSRTYKDTVNDLIINVPPGTTKTTMASIMFPAWCWTRWYWMEFIGLSYSGPLSLESAEAHRELVKSDLFNAVYPDLSIKTDKDAKSNFKVLKEFSNRPGYPASKKTGGARYSTSVGGTLTGFHGHIILVDDPINPQQAVSPVKLESTNNWLDSTLPTRKVHKSSSPIIYIMQRLKQDDPTGHKLDKKDNVDHICLPGEIENYEDQVKPAHLKKHYSEEGLLDPVRMTWDDLNDLKTDLGQYGYAGQIGQTPSPPSGGMFKVDNIRCIPRPQNHEFMAIVRYWDKAGTDVEEGQSKNKGPAYTVGLKMARLTNNRFLIMDVVRGRWSSGKREQVIKATAQNDGFKCHVAIEQEPGSGGKESAEATVKNLAGFNVHVDNPSGDKIYRADPFSVQVEYNNVFMLAGDWNEDLIEEYRYFPHGYYKDQVDAGSGAFQFLSNVKEARMIS